MQTWDAIRSRRNVRQYTDQPLTAHELDQILEAGRRSPSSRNWQPWDFVVVTDHAQLAPAVSGSSGTRPASPRGSASGEYRRPRDRCMEGVQIEQIQITATLPKIAPGNLSEFKEVARRALELTKGETTTLQYDWFFNDDETKCVVRETYANSDAVLAHVANMGDLIGNVAELGGGLEIEAFGDPSPELLKAAAAFEPTIYRFFQGK